MIEQYGGVSVHVRGHYPATGAAELSALIHRYQVSTNAIPAHLLYKSRESLEAYALLDPNIVSACL